LHLHVAVGHEQDQQMMAFPGHYFNNFKELAATRKYIKKLNQFSSSSFSLTPQNL